MTELETQLLSALEQLQQDYSQRLDEWERSLSGLLSTSGALREENATLSARAEGLSGQVESLSAQVWDLNGQAESLSAQVRDLGGQVESLSAQLLRLYGT